MKLTGTRTYYRPAAPKMPPGLMELMEGLTKEILKYNPTDIYGFCANHVQKLLEIRDGPPRIKSLTLEEKIARAQEKVRLQAEKRRQQFDKEFFFMHSAQNSGNSAITNASSDKSTPPLSSLEATVANALKEPVHHEQSLVNLSEVEVSHEVGAELVMPSEASGYEKIKNQEDAALKDNNDFQNSVNTETITTEDKPKNVTDKVEATDRESEDYIKQDIVLNESPTQESIIDLYMLKNEHSMAKENINSLNDSIIADIEEQSNEKHAKDIDNTNEPSSSTVTGSDADKLKDLSQSVDENTPNVNIDSSGNPNLINLQTVTDVNAIDIELPQSDMSLSTEQTEKPTDGVITNPVNISEYVELINCQNIHEDNKEINTIDFCFQESPTVELQSPPVKSDMLASQAATKTDNDITTLIDQDSSNYEPMLQKSDSSETKDQPLPESNITNFTDESNDMNNSHQINQMDDGGFEHSNNSHDVNSTNENSGIDNSGHDTPLNSIEIYPTSNQETTNMDLETAAVTIQKVFRTFLFKSRASTFDDTVNDETINDFLDEDDKNKEECDFTMTDALNVERRPHGITRMDTVLQTVNEEKSLSLSTDDSSTLSSAATIIQAHVRGFLVRNKLNSNKTVSTNSLAASNSKEPSLTSMETDNDLNKNKTILNIHIVPEGGNYLNRDESLITSMDLSLDSSPPSSINLHPLSYDVSEKRKMLKREDAVQSISPPSNNSGKLSDDVDSVKELPLHVNAITTENPPDESVKDNMQEAITTESVMIGDFENKSIETAVSFNEKVEGSINNFTENSEIDIQKRKSLTKINSDEMDVVTPFISNEENSSSDLKLEHSGEFHDAVLPTKVSRSDTSVASGE